MGRPSTRPFVCRPELGMLSSCSERPALPEAFRGSWALNNFNDLPVPDGGRSLEGLMFPAEPHRSQDLWDERLCFH